MSKYLKFYIGTELATGTSDSNGIPTDKLIDSTQGFELDGISLGDLISTAAGVTQVVAVESASITVTTGEGIADATAYKVYNQEGDRTAYQLVPLSHIATVAQTATTTTVIQTTAAANATITITHTAYGTVANQAFALKVLAIMAEAASPSENPKYLFELEEGSSSVITGIAVS